MKRYRGDVSRELAKAVAVAELAGRHRFVAPKVLSHDAEAGTITYSWLGGLVSLRDLYVDYMRSRDPDGRCTVVMELAGDALATLHRELALADLTPWEAPLAFKRAADRRLGLSWSTRLAMTPQVPLHCDFGFGNVHALSGAPARIALLDPSPNEYLTFDPLTIGSSYIDVATMVACLWGLVPVAQYIRFDWRRQEVVEEAFLGAYERTSGASLDRSLLRGVTVAVMTTYLERRLGSGWLARAASSVIERSRRASGGQA